MAAPLVSAIIAVYNGEECVARAIDSVLAQQFDSFELIVVDDASRDSTPRILAGYGDRIRVIRREKNCGLAAGRNLAVDQSGCQYVAFLDADAVPSWYALVTDDGKSYPLVKDAGARMFFKNGVGISS